MRVKLLGRSAVLILSGVGLVVQACSGSPDRDDNSMLVSAVTANPVLSSTGYTAVAIQASPNAECVLLMDGRKDTDLSKLKLFADDEGTVRFSVGQANNSGTPPVLSLECEGADGGKFQRPVDLAVSAAAGPPRVPKNAIMRPPLTGDPMRLTQGEIARLGYPPRPDPKTSPDEFAHWLQLASRPTAVVPAKLRARPDVVHRPAKPAPNMPVIDNISGSDNWSGIVLDQPSTVYGVVHGSWRIPTVGGSSGISGTLYSSIWVGLDGLTSGDVVQAGSEQDVAHSGSTFVSTFSLWTEWFPENSQTISNATVAAGDLISTSVWVGDSGSGLNPNGGFGWFSLWVTHSDNTQVQYESSTPIPSGVTFVGDSAEFILERPTVGGTEYPLPDYSSALMDWTYADDSTGTVLHNRETDSFLEVWMYNASDLLSEGIPTTEAAFGGTHDTVTFDWENFQ